MYNTTRGNEGNEETIESTNEPPTTSATHVKPRKSHPPLSLLGNPSYDFLNVNYTKSELQRYCSQLQLGGIWTTKDKLIEKLMQHYSSTNRQPPSPHALETDTSQAEAYEDNDIDLAGLVDRFRKFERETNDNFYVVNSCLTEKEKEINELKTKLFLAEEKIKALEDTLRSLPENTSVTVTLSTSTKKTLLIGDSGLQEIRFDDLEDNITIRTLHEANMTILKSWITEKLSCPIKECIIYCGIQDLLDEETTFEEITDCLGTIVAELKRRDEDTYVCICELVPTLKSNEFANKVSQYNSKVSEWCTHNNISFIKTEKYFRLGTGDIDINCFDSHEDFDYDNLSRIGAIRLLDAISSAYQGRIVSSDWSVRKQKPLGVGRKNDRRSFPDYGGRGAGSYQSRLQIRIHKDVNKKIDIT